MLSLRDREWGEFQLSSVFSIQSTSSSIDKIKLVSGDGNYPYITRTDRNNGVESYVCEQPDYKIDLGNCITVGLDTQTAFYQPTEFYTGQNIQILRNEKLNSRNAKFILPLLKNLLTIFNWGSSGATLTRLRRSKILLPLGNDDAPDWQFMAQYVCERELLQFEEYAIHANKILAEIGDIESVLPPKEKGWKPFMLSDIFDIRAGKRLTRADMKTGTRPFIGATDANNGITAFVSNNSNSMDSNVLGVNYNGSVVETFYHPYECIFSDDVKRFKLKDMEINKFIYLFLKTIIVQQKKKYAYGYKFNEQRMKKQFLLLPVDDIEKPDWGYMEQYAKLIIRQQLTAYLRLKDKM